MCFPVSFIGWCVLSLGTIGCICDEWGLLSLCLCRVLSRELGLDGKLVCLRQSTAVLSPGSFGDVEEKS